MKPQLTVDSLSAHEVVETLNLSGAGNYVIVCEHASNFIPAELEHLGLSARELNSHVAWDAGALEVAQVLSHRLDAPLVAAKISRLVYDCNRVPGAPSAVVVRSEHTDIPGNKGLSGVELAARTELVYQPFFNALQRAIESRKEQGRHCAVITVHSFTPVFDGVKRDLDLGILHDVDARLADGILDLAQSESDILVQRNAPYSPRDGVTHTLVEHGVSKGRPNVMLEIRNDLILQSGGQKQFGERLADWIKTACERLTKIDARSENGW